MIHSQRVQSLSASVRDWIENLMEGTIFFSSDVKVEGRIDSIRQIISRLAKSGVIIRLTTGIYLYPKVDELLGVLKPTLDEIARAIARRYQIQLQPTGATALNRLGLSTQVPMLQVYLTNGPARRIAIGKSCIVFKKRALRRVAFKSEIVALVIAAMEELGPSEVNDNIVKQRFRNALKHESWDVLQSDFELVSGWKRVVLTQLLPVQLVG